MLRISASEQVRNWLQGLSTDIRRRVRQDLRALAAGRGGSLDVKALRRELEGFYRLRVADYRIVYHLEAGPGILLDYADIRDTVYDAFRVLRGLREEP